MDTVSKQQRSANMAAVKGRDTTPELAIRKILHGVGYLYCVHPKDLPGRPDIVFRRRKVAVFINGCFWHRHIDCKYASMPKTNVEYWREKLEKNAARDIKNRTQLEGQGYRVVTLWECEIRRSPEQQADIVKGILGQPTEVYPKH